jgi:hypothetical protein
MALACPKKKTREVTIFMRTQMQFFSCSRGFLNDAFTIKYSTGSNSKPICQDSWTLYMELAKHVPLKDCYWSEVFFQKKQVVTGDMPL